MQSITRHDDPDLTILVLGAASPTGRSFARGLRRSNKYAKARLVGGDVFQNAYTWTEDLFDVLVRTPRYDDESHVEIIRSIVRRYDIDACLVFAELEAMALAVHDLGVPVCLPPPGFSSIAGNKADVFDALGPLGLAPRHVNDLTSDGFEAQLQGAGLSYPIWLRLGAAGTTSGAGSFLANAPSDIATWFQLTSDNGVQASEYLPGRNWACLMIYVDGVLTATGIYERLSYIMARAAPSGVTGNISLGRICWNEKVFETSRSALAAMEKRSQVPLNGFLTVDLKEDGHGRPLLTEINLKPVACVGSFCNPGYNLPELYVDAVLGTASLQQSADHVTARYREHYEDPVLILRDVDGEPQLVKHVTLPGAGEELGRPVRPDWF